MDVHYYPDPVLRERARPVEQFDDALADLAREMVKTMNEADGLGLAGPHRVAEVLRWDEAAREAPEDRPRSPPRL